MGNVLDLTGKTFGELTVIKRAEDYISPSGYKMIQWECKCSCGQNNKYGIGFTENTNKKFYFDLEDYDKIKKYCWSEDHEGYIIAPAEKNGIKTKIRLHRLIMDVLDLSKNILIDHINHNTYDNRKNNLRIVSSSQNSMNHKILKKNRWGTSGIRFVEERNKWRAQIVINRQTIELGTFNNKEDAIKARKEAEEKYFGEYSYENSMKISQKNEVI